MKQAPRTVAQLRYSLALLRDMYTALPSARILEAIHALEAELAARLE